VVLEIYVTFSLDLRMPVSIYKERYGIPYSLSSSRRWFVTLSYQQGCREYASIGRRDQRRCGKRSSGLRSAEYLESAEKLRRGKLNSVYFCPQTAKNGTVVLTHPTGGHQAGQCHASSSL